MRRMGMGMLTAAMAISFSLVSVVAEAATVPNVVRQPFAAARTALGRAGLRARGAGTVNTNIRSLIEKMASQSPRPGTSVPRGTVVALRVFRFGSAQRVRVPSVVR
ncbi:MAG: PASTA domain-containing protein [Nitrospinota bacterium]